MSYLFLQVQRASGLKARQGKPNGMSDPFCHVVVGKQRARTHIVQVRQRACTPSRRLVTHLRFRCVLRAGYAEPGVERRIHLCCGEAAKRQRSG